MAALQAALAKFRSQAVQQSNVLDQARKDREEKLQKKAAAEAKQAGKKPATKRPRSRTPAATASDGGAAASPAAGPTDWRAMQAVQMLDPLTMRQHTVLDFLRRMEVAQTVPDILRGTNRDLRVEQDLADALAGHSRVIVSEDGATYAYQSAVPAKDRSQLLDYLRRASEPVPLNEVADAYGAARQDVEALRREGHVLVLHSYDLQEDVIFPVDPRLAGLAPVDSELAALWAAQELPDDDEDMAAELRKIGLPPAPRKAPRKRGPSERKKKARRQMRMRHVTNLHLLDTGIFEGDAPTQID